MCTVMWGLYVDLQLYKVSGTHMVCSGRNICSGEYANNVKFMYIIVHDHFVDCIGII